MYPWLVREASTRCPAQAEAGRQCLALYILAQATKGLLQDENGKPVGPKKVLYVHQYEDVPEAIIYPRLDMMDADPIEIPLADHETKVPDRRLSHPRISTCGRHKGRS